MRAMSSPKQAPLTVGMPGCVTAETGAEVGPFSHCGASLDMINERLLQLQHVPDKLADISDAITKLTDLMRTTVSMNGATPNGEGYKPFSSVSETGGFYRQRSGPETGGLYRQRSGPMVNQRRPSLLSIGSQSSLFTPRSGRSGPALMLGAAAAEDQESPPASRGASKPGPPLAQVRRPSTISWSSSSNNRPANRVPLPEDDSKKMQFHLGSPDEAESLPNLQEAGEDADSNEQSSNSSSSSSGSEKQAVFSDDTVSKGFSWNLSEAGGGVSMDNENFHKRLTRKSTTVGETDADELRHSPLAKLGLRPDSNMVITWDSTMLFCIMVVAILVPIRVVYFRDDPLPNMCSGLLGMADIAFIADMMLNCFIGLYVEVNGTLLVDVRAIAKAYVKSWLAADILASWPACAVWSHRDNPVHSTLSLLKLLKIFKLPLHVGRLQDRFRGSNVSILKIVLPLLIILNLMACIWSCVMEYDGFSSELDFGEHYMADIYWVMLTITSVGYGDIVPAGCTSRLFASGVMFFSSFYAGLVVSSTSRFLKFLFDDDLERQTRDASRFMREREVPASLEKRVQYFLRVNLIQEKSLVHAPVLLATLPVTMQRQLALSLLQKTLIEFPLFAHAQTSFLGQIAQACSWEQVHVGDVLVERGQLERELIFVTAGQALMFRPKPSLTPLPGSRSRMSSKRNSFLTGLMPAEDTVEDLDEIKCPAGSWFGERCLFSTDHVRNYTVLAEHPGELAVLAATAYQDALKMYPHLMAGHLILYRRQVDGQLDFADLAYCPAATQDGPATTAAWITRGLQRISLMARSKG